MALRADDVDLARDRDLVVRSQAGDDGAFEDLYRRYFDRLYRFCLRRVGDPHEAEELAQETFARAYRALPKLAGDRRFYPWLSVIASRLCVDEFRRRSRSEPAAVIDLGVGEDGQDRILQAVDTDLLGRAMARLTPRHQDVLRLREHEGWSYQHIADSMGVNLGTVEALLHRARRALKREFDLLAGPETVPAVVGGGLVARLARRLQGLRLRARAAEWAATSWGPALGNAVAATAVVAAAAVGGGASARAAVPVQTTPSAAARATPAPTLVAGAPAPALATAPAPATRPVPSLVAQRDDDPATLVGGDIVYGSEARKRTEDQPTSDGAAGVLFGIDPHAAVMETAETVDHTFDELEADQ
jgi:RNA polymerase sigma-70 factor (ECF subfamily)